MFADKIIKIKKEEIENLKKPKNNVFERFKKNKFNIISEIKKASPSKGDINTKADILKIAKGYINNGASMISILTEEKYFKGNINDLKLIRENIENALILRKDFIIDEYQIYESKITGADMILLIPSFVGNKKAKKLYKLAKGLGLEVLLEVHDEKQMLEALEFNSNFIGINNRNLKTLETSLDTARQLSKYITDDKIFVCESAINSSEQIKEMINLGYNSFLIGSYLMSEKNPPQALKKLIEGIEND